MRVKDIGGEFALINRLARRQTAHDPRVIKGIGDDCAVLDLGGDKYTLMTADMLVEDTHFKREWLTPEQIGRKVVECNASDIISMGGTPRYGVLSMSLPENTDLAFIDDLYQGVYASAKIHGIVLVGGDTTRGSELVFDMSLIGDVGMDCLRLRSMAKDGDMVCVTGRLGGSAGGLKLFENGILGEYEEFLYPRSRLAREGSAIAKYANAMIDVSDGLGGDLAHICEESSKGALIFKDSIPLSKTAEMAAELLSLSPYDLALYGGEDYELIFTLPEKRVGPLRRNFRDFSVIGRIMGDGEGVALSDGETESHVGHGYDHFTD